MSRCREQDGGLLVKPQFPRLCLIAQQSCRFRQHKRAITTLGASDNLWKDLHPVLERHQRLAPTLTGYGVRILGPDLACIITDTGLTVNSLLNPGNRYYKTKYPFDNSRSHVDFTDVTHVNYGPLADLMSLLFETFSGSCFRWLALAQPHARGFSHTIPVKSRFLQDTNAVLGLACRASNITIIAPNFMFETRCWDRHYRIMFKGQIKQPKDNQINLENGRRKFPQAVTSFKPAAPNKMAGHEYPSSHSISVVHPIQHVEIRFLGCWVAVIVSCARCGRLGDWENGSLEFNDV
ncbi:hypothetical protein CEK26_003827 [Fusarium fujikuroi]|nr:hypothetical protein CEK27_003816 [Fusarium fujikuroi]QGI77046.1 hypothetical protein CEK25_003775 [Fusarium fujikuroi]QGI90758.1 hypothetical protein CEK26_003827 [Fusarium fujikuroi]